MIQRTFLVVLVVVGMAAAQHQHQGPGDLPAEHFTSLGDTHHPVSTHSPEAQKSFDEGLTLLYGFNHEEAARAFQRAAQQDPNLAMAYWGAALVSGVNYNAPEFPEMLRSARANLQKAQALASKASASDQAYIAALTKRYDEKNDDVMQREHAYSEAMRDVMESFPDDLDAATLYAESLMNQNPWKLWTNDGKPGPNTEQVIAILESVLRRNPRHIGANHYYIHAVEASPNPERGLASADRLRDLHLSAGHLVHMPAHIYWRTGDYVSAADANVIAAKIDRDYLGESATKPGIYAMMYYSHNLHFQALADIMAGRYNSARKAAEMLADHVQPALKDMPMVEAFMPVKTYVLVRFGKWDDVLALPEPDKSLRLHHGTWLWARGLAESAKGDLAAAKRESDALHAAVAAAPPDAMVDKNSLANLLGIADHMLAARIAAAGKDFPSAQHHYEEAVAIHDRFNYIEPPEWPFPVRESLGAMLLKSGRAPEAEKVFREDLAHNPRNGRSLFGLVESLKAQNKDEAARLVEMEFKPAWQNADVELNIDELELGSPRPGTRAANAQGETRLIGSSQSRN
jgi:tetratricopeptide (TPR) repeat protein